MTFKTTEEANRELTERLQSEHKTFLDSMVRNHDRSVTIQRIGKMIPATIPDPGFGSPSTVFIDSIPAGIPGDDREYIAKVAKEMGYQPNDKVEYTITIRPKSK